MELTHKTINYNARYQSRSNVRWLLIALLLINTYKPSLNVSECRDELIFFMLLTADPFQKKEKIVCIGFLKLTFVLIYRNFHYSRDLRSPSLKKRKQTNVIKTQGRIRRDEHVSERAFPFIFLLHFV
ncbi:unnamed protein product [Albugo candida]|uniref:Uncharacterized protein n=1 Tax=Albugo candida TaxID=65357 RepID=A0A024GGW4_9STRA|nr:unnamed protein product [Albugo candida]|eukprot:CCI45585.1 unnamed protein product [Albugo candida]